MLGDDIKNLNLSSKHLFLITFSLVAAIAVYNWFIKPHSQYLLATENYKNALSTIDQKHKLISSQLKSKEKKLVALQSELQKNQAGFFDSETARIFLEDLQVISQNSGCLVNSIKFMPPEHLLADEKYKNIDICKYKVNLNLLGQYSNMVNTISKIQKREQKVWVESINLQASENNSGYIICDLDIEIYTIQAKEAN